MTQANRKWTLMVYMAADNGKVFEEHGGKKLMYPMEEQGRKDLKKMEAIGSTEEVSVLVQFDTLSDRDHTYRIYIPSKGQERETLYIPEQNTGDPTSLRDFIIWGVENYPAENYAVVLWNHGTGWKEDDIYEFARSRGIPIQATEDEVRSVTRGHRRLSRAFFLSSIAEVLQIEDDESRGIAYDDSSLDFLDNAKLQQAFREAEDKTGQKVSLIGMDACLMSMVEVAYQLRTNANYMVASQELEPMDGWPYTAILETLSQQPEMTPAELSKLIVKEYGYYYDEQKNSMRGGEPRVTQSAANLAMMENLAQAIGKLSNVLRQLLVEKDIYVRVALGDAQRKALRFHGDEDFVDLYDFVKHLRDEYGGENKEFITVVNEVINFIELTFEPQLILANVASGVTRSGQKLSCARGLSIYLPENGCSQFYQRSEFSSSGWGDFIKFHNGVN
jgi:Clostripain family